MVSIGVLGFGCRGAAIAHKFNAMEHAKVATICDISTNALNRACAGDIFYYDTTRVDLGFATRGANVI